MIDFHLTMFQPKNWRHCDSHIRCLQTVTLSCFRTVNLMTRVLQARIRQKKNAQIIKAQTKIYKAARRDESSFLVKVPVQFSI